MKKIKGRFYFILYVFFVFMMLSCSSGVKETLSAEIITYPSDKMMVVGTQSEINLNVTATGVDYTIEWSAVPVGIITITDKGKNTKAVIKADKPGTSTIIYRVIKTKNGKELATGNIRITSVEAIYAESTRTNISPADYLDSDLSNIVNNSSGTIKYKLSSGVSDYVMVDEETGVVSITNSSAIPVNDTSKGTIIKIDIYQSNSEGDVIIGSATLMVYKNFTPNDKVSIIDSVVVELQNQTDSRILIPDETLQLVSHVTSRPDNDENKKVDWSTDNENVTVDANGLVTVQSAATAGTVNITATSSRDVTKSDSISIDVITINSVTVSPKTPDSPTELAVGKTTELKATVDCSSDEEVFQNVTWSSDYDKVSVDNNGLVTIQDGAETNRYFNITATSARDTRKKGSIQLRVTDPDYTKYSIVLHSSSQFKLSIGDRSEKTWDGKIYYNTVNDVSSNSIDGWTEWTGTEIVSGKNDSNPNSSRFYIYLRGNGNTCISNESESGKTIFNVANADGDLVLDGNMMNLLQAGSDSKVVSGNNSKAITGDYCFSGLFRSCTDLKKLGDYFQLPATTLKDSCYNFMFYGCTNLKFLPKNFNLPATTLAKNCYRSMFYNCNSLESLPSSFELNATTLAEGCYYSMFMFCKKLFFKKDIGENDSYRLFLTLPNTIPSNTTNQMFTNTGSFDLNTQITPEANSKWYVEI